MKDNPVGVVEGFDQSKEAIEYRLKLEGKLKSGGGWFYWIAILSIVNSIVVLANFEWSFLIGLGVTQFIQGVTEGAMDGSTDTLGSVRFLGFGITVLISGVFIFFGRQARKGNVSIFYVGMILYAMDSILPLVVGDFLGFGFHLFALFGLYSGVRACKELQNTEGNSAIMAEEPLRTSHYGEPEIYRTDPVPEVANISEQLDIPPKDKKHSGFGVASFSVTMFAFVLFIIAFVIILTTPTQTNFDEEYSPPEAILGGLLLMMGGFLVIVALGLGFASLFQRGKSKLFGIMGLVFSGSSIALGCLALIFG